MERVRKEAARDIHDELGHLVTRISLFGEIARQRLPASMNGGSPAEYLQRITDTSKDLAEGLGDFVWTLDPKCDSVLDVLVRLKDFGDKLFSHTGIDFHVTGLEDDLARIHLSLHWRRHLTMLFKEGMTNVLKHSRGSSVELRVVRQGDLLQLSLGDNGHGFNMQSAARSRGHGLHNMDERARKLGGRVTIESKEGRGTRLSFTGNIPGDEK
jgi:signal transduction histidine kinase